MPTLAGYTRLPELVRLGWGRRADPSGEWRDIFEIEAVGPLLVLHNLGELIHGSLWLHFINNEAALCTLVKGSSSVMSGEVITCFTHELIAKYDLWPWFDRVDSKSNPVDQLSGGGVMKGNWTLVPSVFPPKLIKQLDASFQ